MLAFLVATLPLAAHAIQRTIFVSSARTPQIFALGFDNETSSLYLTRTLFGNGGSPWLAFNWDKSALYTAERNMWTSYKVVGTDGLEAMNSVDVPYCPAQNRDPGSTNGGKRGDTVVYASPRRGGAVYGSGGKSCGVVIGTGPDGRFRGLLQNITYHSSSKIGGMAMDSEGKFLYAADQNDSGLWVYRVNQQTGRLESGGVLDFPIEDARPRRIVIHPSGQYAYVLLQKLCQVAIFEVHSRGDYEKPYLRFTNTTIALLPFSKSHQ